jgi:glycogen operon protein
VRLGAPDWSDASHSLAATSRLLSHRAVLHVMINAYWEPLEFELPPPDGDGPWRRIVDTALASPDDVREWDDAPALRAAKYSVQPRSIALLMARTG